MSMTKSKAKTLNIPMSSPDLSNAEREAVAAVLRTPNLSMGKEIQDFEAAFCQLTGSKHAIGVNSGTAGLHLCVLATSIKDGDLVITTPFSFIASSNVLLYERAVPVFVDVEPHTGNIDPHLVRAAAQDIMQGGRSAEAWLPPKGADPSATLKAILPVDVFGQPADMVPILSTANKYGLKVIEDSCEALGAVYLDRPAGAWGHYGVFAFYPNKQITTGEGGVIVTNDDRAAAMMRALRNQGRAPNDTWLQHTYLGYNYRLDEMSAAIGKVQMGRLDELMEKRACVAGWYQDHLKNIAGVEVPRMAPTTTRPSWFVYVVRLDVKIDRQQVIYDLAERGIPARPYFNPIHLQPFMTERFGFQPGDFPVTEDLGRRSLALPFSGVMTEEQVAQVCANLSEVL
jgi:dTDP-4-amino-4,6-dideoxygalactose transaminase